MSRRYRRRKHNNRIFNFFFTIILLFLIGLLCYKFYVDKFESKSTKSNMIKKVENKINNKK